MMSRGILPVAIAIITCVVFETIPVNVHGIIIIVASIATSELIHEVFYGYI